MKQVTEIILNDEAIDTIEYGLLNLKEGDVFYFSLDGTCPKSEKEYSKKNVPVFGENFVNEYIAEINQKSSEFHIKRFEVVSISKSYSKSYMLDISNPQRVFTESIIVKEYIGDKN